MPRGSKLEGFKEDFVGVALKDWYESDDWTKVRKA